MRGMKSDISRKQGEYDFDKQTNVEASCKWMDNTLVTLHAIHIGDITCNTYCPCELLKRHALLVTRTAGQKPLNNPLTSLEFFILKKYGPDQI